MASDRLKVKGEAILPLALGTVKIGRNRDVKYPRGFELPDDAQVEALLEGALARGVRCFDSAPAYGRAEQRLQGFVRRHRAEILLISKAGEVFDERGSQHDFSAAAIRSSCERSLRRLGCERLDFLLLHSDGGRVEALADETLLETLRALRDEGKLRWCGLSAKTAQGVRRAAAELDAVMAPYSATRSELAPALREAHAAGATVLAIKVLDSGHAAPEEALRHVFAQPFVDAVVLGTLQLAHLEQAIAVARELRG